MKNEAYSDVARIKKIIDFLNDNFPIGGENLVLAYHPKTKKSEGQLWTWHVVVRDYTVYVDKEFGLCVSAVRTKFPTLSKRIIFAFQNWRNTSLKDMIIVR